MGIRDTSYYGWNNIFTIDASIFPFDTRNALPAGSSHNIGSYSHINDFKINPLTSSLFYVAATIYTNRNNVCKWVVYRSKDFGKNWSISDVDPANSEQSSAMAIDFDLSGNVYIAGCVSSSSFAPSPGSNELLFRATIRKSLSGDSGSWATIDSFDPNGHWQFATTGIKASYKGIKINALSGGVYACGVIDQGKSSVGGFVRYSADGSSGSFSNLYGFHGTDESHGMHAIELWKDANDKEVLVVAGTSGSATDGSATARYPTIWYSQRSTPANHSGNLIVAYNRTEEQNDGFVSLTRSGSSIFAIGAGDFGPFLVSKSSISGSSGTFVDLDSGDQGTLQNLRSIAVNAIGDVYTCGFNSNLVSPFVRASFGGISGAFTEVYQITSAGSLASNFSELTKIVIDKDDIFICGDIKNYQVDDGLINAFTSQPFGGFSFIKKGKRSVNSGSLGPRMLATSFGYVQSEISGVITEAFKLNNVSEFPHSSGLFQMPNMVLGTKSSGRSGKTDDSIIQKTFVGSFVRVLFPRQDETDVRGFDIGRQPGKLSTEWQFGDPINIENKQFDSLALNCYASVLVSGTMDSVLIRVETKGLNDLGFAVDQTVEQTISSSFASEAVHRDDILRKDINYGDTSLSEISWKIPVDLKNVKEIRLAARHKAGQADDKNKQFLVIGRFIKSSKNTEEV